MWTAIRKQWDYFALTFLLGLYVTAAFAALSLRSWRWLRCFDHVGGVGYYLKVALTFWTIVKSNTCSGRTGCLGLTRTEASAII